ncbi:hypothetical protein [Aestuariivirga sp.]|uniref:hypothetical protein n=1 Tax=Aestuariivirga sp. TaxID=2650926 RepID=UPI0025BB21C8|nr:hypothetical protein [Aestuariivirga sp.]MCA3555642.1 hypothetical protein [Aestuariivirga sp.]
MLSAPETLVLESFGLCVLAFVAIVALHLVGLHVSIRLFHMKFNVGNIHSLPQHRAMIVILAAMMLLFGLHMMTNFAWGLFMHAAGALPTYREGVYYSLENYTALGLTRVDVDDRWRMLAPMISMSGVFCLSWSTALLVSFFGQIYRIRPNG